jgi:hypothetical protein
LSRRLYESIALPSTSNIGVFLCFLCWIAMGYRMSRQRSLRGYSQYFLLFTIEASNVLRCKAKAETADQVSNISGKVSAFPLPIFLPSDLKLPEPKL